MHLSHLVLLFATVNLAAADDLLQLFKRQTTTPVPCSEQGLKDCGTGCIDPSATCCPDRKGGCRLGTYCSLGSNGQYGCCTNGRICSGPGGVNSDISTITSTRTTPVAGAGTSRVIVTTPTSRTPVVVPVLTSTSPAFPSFSSLSVPSLSIPVFSTPIFSAPSSPSLFANPGGSGGTTTSTGAIQSALQGMMLGFILAVVILYLAV